MLGGVRGWGREAPAYSMFAQHGHYLGGESPLWVQYRQRRRKPLAEDKCKLARACMKEVGGKIPSQRTETGYEAGRPDESAAKDEVPTAGWKVNPVATWEER